MNQTVLRAPFPYFGGKRRAAPIIWSALGDPGGYVEPFGGSAAVLLARPRFAGRRVETLNDADGWLVNTWRAIQQSPVDVAKHASGPMTEIDYHARLAWLQERRNDGMVSWLEGHPENHDAKAAAWWLYVMAAGIGNPFDKGPWRVIEGRLTDTRELPHLGDAGQGIARGLPHLGDAGRGIARGLPHLGDAGQTALEAYMLQLASRLAHVRITCGDWRRVLTSAVMRVKLGGDGAVGILLDPPYETSGDVYAHGESDGSLSAQSRRWCMEADGALRIVLCGYEGEHDALLDHGWTVIQGAATTGGYGGVGTRSRERLWLSPACVNDTQGVLL